MTDQGQPSQRTPSSRITRITIFNSKNPKVWVPEQIATASWTSQWSQMSHSTHKLRFHSISLPLIVKSSMTILSFLRKTRTRRLGIKRVQRRIRRYLCLPTAFQNPSIYTPMVKLHQTPRPQSPSPSDHSAVARESAPTQATRTSQTSKKWRTSSWSRTAWPHGNMAPPPPPPPTSTPWRAWHLEEHQATRDWQPCRTIPRWKWMSSTSRRVVWPIHPLFRVAWSRIPSE